MVRTPGVLPSPGLGRGPRTQSQVGSRPSQRTPPLLSPNFSLGSPDRDRYGLVTPRPAPLCLHQVGRFSLDVPGPIYTPSTPVPPGPGTPLGCQDTSATDPREPLPPRLVLVPNVFSGPPTTVSSVPPSPDPNSPNSRKPSKEPSPNHYRTRTLHFLSLLGPF